jgi:hypothetical protein
MSREDIEHGLALARLSGELAAVGEVVDLLQMPVLSEFLDERGGTLQEMAVDQILLAGSTRSLARAIEAAGGRMADLGENEVAEGIVRVGVSEGLEEAGQELDREGRRLERRGAAEMVEGVEMGRAARDVATVGAAEIEAGGEAIGAGETAEEVGETLEDRARR